MPFVNETITEDGRIIYRGLCIDLMDRLSEIMGFGYRLRTVEDGRFGGQDEDGNWMGLIGDLVNQVSNSDFIINAGIFNIAES